MDAASPLETYREICDRFLRAQGIEDLQKWMDYSRELQAQWISCFPRLLDLAETGDPEVWYALGDAFGNGRGTERNRDEATRYLRRAAEVGHARSMVRLGALLHLPDTPATHSSAIDWFRKAAALGYSGAMVSLGFAYREGHGVQSDTIAPE